MSRLPLCVLLLSVHAVISSVRAQTMPAIAPDQPLSLEAAIALAVGKNFDLQLQSITVEQQKETLNIARADFDPTLTGAFTRTFRESPISTTLLEGTTNDDTGFLARVEERLPWTNGVVRVEANLNRAATNNPNQLLNPTFGNSVSASITQPLLRNAGSTVARANIARSKIGVGIAYIAYKSQVLALIADTENFYYNLVAARETLRIRQLSLELAQRLFDENSARRQSGVMTDLDVLSAEVGVANARRGVIQAEQSVRDAEDALLNLINVPSLDARPGPVQFNDYTDGAPNFATSYKLARDFYPQTLSAEEVLKQLQIDLDVARRNRLPNVSLTAGLGYVARPTNQSYSDVISNLPSDHGQNWSLGLTYSTPWGRRADKARFRQAQLSVSAQKVRIDQLEQDLMVSVRTAIRSVETNLSAVEIAAQATRLSERQYEQQKARFDAGLSTSRAVLQAQDDLENTRFQELSAKLTLRRAATELRRLEGSSIRRYGIQLPE